ncbi:MAG: hypothetical protein IJS46_02895 [Kiritimatiellae bacterium]|nr:hypothetical protein [Kiritimatiellia bacterium]
MTSDFEQTIATVRNRVEAMKRALGPNDESRLVAERPDTPRGFTAAVSSSSGSTIVVGGIMRTRPGAGAGAAVADIDAAQMAREIERGGASAVSVSTERTLFGGSVEDLQAAREASRLPVLRRDFIIDPYQVPRSYGAGADAILVIVKAVPDDATLHRIFDSAERLRLDVVSEICDEADAARLLEIGADSPSALRVVGVGDSDFAPGRSGAGDMAALSSMMPDSTFHLCLAPIGSRAEIDEIRAAAPRISRFLVSSALSFSDDPAGVIHSLLDEKS